MRKRYAILVPAVFVVFVVAWELIVRIFEVPSYLVPSPYQVTKALMRGIFMSPFARDGYWLHAGYTLAAALIGFAAGSTAGIVIGTIISQSREIEAVLKPYIVAFQSLPKVALAPIIVIWFGFGISSKVVICALLTFFPLMVNSLEGFKSVDNDRIELMRSLSATRWQIFRLVSFPSALPFIFAGLDMAIVYSIIGAIVGEFIGGRDGLGVLIVSMNYALDMAGAFSVFIVLSIMGITLSAILNVIRHRVLFWAPSARQQRSIGA
jgi:NitT/TauT family transport system permease protein